jgi:hypothetical protein
VVFEGVEAMPVDEEVEVQGEGQDQEQAQESRGSPPGGGEVLEEMREEPDDDDLCQECAPKRTLPDPGQPTQQQLEDHRVDHLPYRSWCPECVAGRATGEQHQKRGESKLITTFSMDYLFLTKSRVVDKEALLAGEEVEMKVLVAKDSQSRTRRSG